MMIHKVNYKMTFYNIIVSAVFLISSKPLSAQTDSGYILCNMQFANRLMVIDTSKLSKEDYKTQYFEAVLKWNNNAQKYNAPNFKGITTVNDTFDLANINDKVVVLHFWTTGCAPCIAELPDFDQIFNSYKDSNILFVSIALDNKIRLQKYYKSLMPLIPNATSIFDTYGVIGYPLTIIIGKNKMIKYQIIGFDNNRSDEHDGEIKAKIDEAIKE